MARGAFAVSDLRPVDWVHAGFYAFVLLAALVRLPGFEEAARAPAGPIEHAARADPAGTFAWFGGALLGTVALARVLRGRRSWGAIVPRALFTVVVAPLTFLRLGAVVPYVNPFHQERLLYDVDTAMFFGHNPNVLLDRIAWPPLTELLQIDYSLYYFIPLVLFVYLVRAKKAEATDRAVFLVLLCLYGSYVGYFLVPATGPNVNELGLYPAHFSEPMKGLWLAEPLRAMLYEAESIKHDCWPSGHTAVAVTALWIARQDVRAAYRVLLVPVALLVFSTMYLRYHYVIDVVFGLALAWAVMRYGPRLRERLAGGSSPSPRSS